MTVDPQIVLVEGDADQLAQLVSIDTSPIPDDRRIRRHDRRGDSWPCRPASWSSATTRSASRSSSDRSPRRARFSAGLRLVGTRRDLTYDFSTDRVIVTIGGSSADLDRLAGSALVVNLDVAGLGPGTVDVPVSIDLPTGPTLVAANPSTVSVTITGTTAPSASLGPTPSAGGG